MRSEVKGSALVSTGRSLWLSFSGDEMRSHCPVLRGRMS